MTLYPHVARRARRVCFCFNPLLIENHLLHFLVPSSATSSAVAATETVPAVIHVAPAEEDAPDQSDNALEAVPVGSVAATDSSDALVSALQAEIQQLKEELAQCRAAHQISEERAVRAEAFNATVRINQCVGQLISMVC